VTVVGGILFIRRRRRIQAERDVEAAPIPQPPSPSLPFQEKIESPVGARPGYDESRYTSPVERSAIASRGSMSSMIIPFYAEARGDFGSDHSRTGSVSSTAQLLPSDVPTVRVPKPPRAAIVSRAPVMVSPQFVSMPPVS
jgi:hypothetical protein